MSKKDSTSRPFHNLTLTGFLLLAILTAVGFFYALFLLYYQDRFFPGVKIAGISVAGQKKAVVREYLQNAFTARSKEPIRLTYQDQTFTVYPDKSLPHLVSEAAIEQGYQTGRSINPLLSLKGQLRALLRGASFEPKLTYDQPSLLIFQVKQINEAIKHPAVNAQITTGGKIGVVPAQNGQELDDRQLLGEIADYLTLKTPSPGVLPIRPVLPAFPTQTAIKYQQLLETSTQSPVKLHYKQQTLTLDPTALLSILNLNENKPVLASGTIGGQNFILEQISFEDSSLSDSQPLIDREKLAIFLQNLSRQIDQPAQEAKFSIDSSSGQIKATQFQPSKEGKKLDIDQTADLITQALAGQGNKDIALPVAVTQPKVTTESVNNLGIKELIGEGVSHFDHSIENRIYNIDLAASRIHGTLVAPGDVFSFNKTVGDISGASGYKPAYVIKSGRTVLDDGGGVCQVSTTVFRAALNSGLPIIDRTAHAYRVGYYEQDSGPGLDATVFAPSVDLKFKNDTGNYILIQTYTVGTALYIDIYGTSDGRQTTVGKPVITSQTSPLPDIRQDDPTLPKGEVKQIDWSAWGATTYFTRTVTRGGESLINETFKSNYRPWAAVYLVGTKE